MIEVDQAQYDEGGSGIAALVVSSSQRNRNEHQDMTCSEGMEMHLVEGMAARMGFEFSTPSSKKKIYIQRPEPSIDLYRRDL